MPVVERLRERKPLPWRRPRAEALLLLLLAAVALSPVYSYSEQDSSRICLSRALVAGRLSSDGCFAYTVDSSRYGGHLYSNKEPGMSVLEIVPAEAVRLASPTVWTHVPDLRLWVVHLFATGLPFLLCAFLVGRVSEGIAPGLGAAALVTFGLGTLVAPLAATGFSHVLAACLGFVAFLLAWRRRPLGAGLAAGAAVTTELDAVLILVVVLAYTALQGRPALLRYAAGAAPGIALLAAYDWAAFGAPWRSALSYSNNGYRAAENSGLLGLHLPTVEATRLTFVGERGLLVTSPVVVAAAAGLVLLWRRGLRAESLACSTITAGFLIAECGYFIPYGGTSPGPRFLAPALPFLALGLAPAFARWRAATTMLAAASLVATTAVLSTWALALPYRDTIWGELYRVLAGHSSSLSSSVVSKDILVWDAGSAAVLALLGVLAGAAFLVAVRPWRGPHS